jgi:hypothetical protein
MVLSVGVSKFPETLKSIRMKGTGFAASESWPMALHILPCTMDHISIELDWVHRRNFTIDDWNALAKMKTLRSLTLNLCSYFASDHASYIPRSVEKLILKYVTNKPTDEWCIGILKALPKNLKKLEGIWPYYISPEVAENMPRTLETVGNREISPEAIRYLPDSFTQILQRARTTTAFPSKIQKLALHRLSEPLAEILPLQLSSLIIEEGPLEAGIASKLPRNLTHLNIMGLLGASQALDTLFKSLPPTLTFFHAATILDVTKLPIPLPVPSHSSMHIPRRLKTLHIGYLALSESDVAEWILGLPQSLTALHLIFDTFPKGCLAALGSSMPILKSLGIHSMKSPEGGWAQHINARLLPRTLAKLSLIDGVERHPDRPVFQSDIIDESFRGAPPLLSNLQIPYSPSLTEGCLAHLPKLDLYDHQYHPIRPKWLLHPY